MAEDASTRRGLLRANDVEVGPAPVRVPTAGRTRRAPRQPSQHAADCAGQPAVEVLRGSGGEVRAIVVQCTCGEQITIECQYQE
jgi:hypothetical protein